MRGFRERLACQPPLLDVYLAEMAGETVAALREQVAELERELEEDEENCIGCGWPLGCRNPQCEFFVSE